MNLPKTFFEPESFKLRPERKTMLKDFFKTQELAKTIDLVGLTPDPENPCPLPWPWYQGEFRDPGQFKKNWIDLRVLQNPLDNITNPNIVGYPDPGSPYPVWPFPWGPWVRDLILEKIINSIANASFKERTYSFTDVVKRENILLESLQELNDDLSDIQYNISSKIKKLS